VHGVPPPVLHAVASTCCGGAASSVPLVHGIHARMSLAGSVDELVDGALLLRLLSLCRRVVSLTMVDVLLRALVLRPWYSSN
jgi:hypothetical protein